MGTLGKRELTSNYVQQARQNGWSGFLNAFVLFSQPFTVKTTPNLNIDSNFFRFKSFVYSFAFPRLRVSRLRV